MVHITPVASSSCNCGRDWHCCWSRLCIVLRQTVLEYRLGISLTAVTLLGVHFLMTVSVTEAILAGTFWGLADRPDGRDPDAMEMVAYVESADIRADSVGGGCFRVHYNSSLLRAADRRTANEDNELRVSTTQCLGNAPKLLPDVLLPETQLPDNNVAYVRKSVLEKWQKKVAVERSGVARRSRHNVAHRNHC